MSRLPKRVLIVDDEPTVAMVLAESLERLSNSYIIETANDATQALEMISRTEYALMITDYKMPGMNGLDLAIAARKAIPGIQIVLMTAYGSEQLQSAADEMGMIGYISKPFTVSQIREIVERAIQRTENNHEDPYRSGKQVLDHPVYEKLKELQTNTGARCVMLISTNGYPVETSGQTDGIDVTGVGALVAANFMAAAELANKLGRGSVFKSSYHEGQGTTDYNLYAYDVNGELLLVVVFGAESKTGAVWFYTKQAAATLESLMGKRLVTGMLHMPASNPALGQEGEKPDTISNESLSSGLEEASDKSFEKYLSKELDNLLKM